jgi:hypothetical protein
MDFRSHISDLKLEKLKPFVMKGSMAFLKKLVPVVFILLCITIFIGQSYGEPDTVLEVGKFSSAQEHGSFPSGWKPLTFSRINEHTQYFLVKNDDTVVVKAVSERSASGLAREISIDPNEYPIVAWRWKVENILENGDVSRKEGDDYSARLYILFEYDSSKVGIFEKIKYEAAKLFYGHYPPIATINYIWANHAPVGTVVPNPYTDRAQMIVTQSGSGKVHQWVTEERNILDDYQHAFGEDPSKISGVAIMTDTDNTQESVIAYFGDIVFKRGKGKEVK